MQDPRAGAPPAPGIPLEDRSMRVLERTVAGLAIAAAVLLAFAR